MRPIPLLSLLSWVLAACAGPRVPEMPSTLESLPWGSEDADQAVLAARAASDRGRGRDALEMLEGILREHPRHVDGHRLRQDILRSRGRFGLVRAEAERRLGDWQDQAEAHYLFGRVQWDDRRRVQAFADTLQRKPDSFWGWLGLAFSQRVQRPARGLELYRSLYAVSGGHPLAAVALASLLRSGENREEALAVYAALRQVPGQEGVADLGAAETLLLMERREDSWAALMSALRTLPHDPGVYRMLQVFLASGVSEEQVQQVLDVLWESPERFADARSRSGSRAVLAALCERVGLLPDAVGLLGGTAAGGGAPIRTAARRHRQRLLLATGDAAGFLRDLRESLPRFVVADERNQLRPRWLALLDPDLVDPTDPLADPGRAEALFEALAAVGLAIEADLVASASLLRHPQGREQLQRRQARLRRERSFEGAVRRLLYQGYRGDGDVALADLLEQVRELSVKILGRDVVGSPRVYEVPLVGSMVDPFAPGLGGWFAERNKHLVLGQRSGGSVEGLLLTRLGLRQLDPHPDLPLEGPCQQVVGVDRRIEVRNGILGGDLAGIALLNHYVVDFDAVRDWGSDLLAQRRVAREDGMALLEDPLPADADPLEPIDVHWRLALQSPVADAELEREIFAMICWHERAHLVDSFRYFPPLTNLGPVLGLLFGQGFDPLSIESEMEGRAETAALALGGDPYLALAHIASFQETPQSGSPHAIGFGRLARRIRQALLVRPDHAQHAAMSRWHLVPAAVFREIGRELMLENHP